QEIFTLLLIGVLIASVISFVVMGLRQLCRTNSLTRKAHEMDLKFSPSDHFDVPRRYGDFFLVSGGHGPRASNVTYGHILGAPVRAFDFRCEIGHATRRMTRHYAVVALKLRSAIGNLVMQHVDDVQGRGLPEGMGTRTIESWSCRGDLKLAPFLAEACEALTDQIISVEVRQDVIMLSVPIEKRRQDYTPLLACAEPILKSIENCYAQ
ncbi:MAG: hypothetical protein HN350_09810, partial [Phycisphaerales bacterium]|nr:hypothetical protein [Phycisphaerales bacterium]